MSRHAAMNGTVNGYDHEANGHALRDDAPRVPIPGAAGVQIFAALNGLAMYAGEMSIVIRKERIAGGGYRYAIARQLPPPDAR